jgi:acyl homoserine lactone synthase
MITLVPGQNRNNYPELMDKMHRQRKSVFHDQLGWDVKIVDEWEIDHYDDLNPLYVLVTDDNSDLVGSVRILPTTGKNMLNDTFPELLPSGLRIESPFIWETSRFTIRKPGSKRDFAKMSSATAELGLALNQIGKIAGISHFVTVYDAMMHRMLQRTSCAGDPISEPKMIGNVLSYAVTYEVGDSWEKTVRDKCEAEVADLNSAPVRQFLNSLAA